MDGGGPPQPIPRRMRPNRSMTIGASRSSRGSSPAMTWPMRTHRWPHSATTPTRNDDGEVAIEVRRAHEEEDGQREVEDASDLDLAGEVRPPHRPAAVASNRVVRSR